MIHTIYTSTFGEWFIDFMKRIGDFIAGGGATFEVFERIILAILFILIGWGLSLLYKFALRKALKLQPKIYLYKKNKNKKVNKDLIKTEATAKGFIIPLVNALHWIFIAVLVVSVLGVDLSSTAGVLSAITVALGLALQDVIGCFASGLIVIANKPLQVGEYVLIKNDYGQCEGTVVKVGIMMTELYTFDGQSVYLPNSTIQKSIITNINRKPDRRLDITVQLSYDEDIEKVKTILLNIGNNDQRVIKDKGVNALVSGLTESGIKMTLRVWTTNDDYWSLMYDFNEKVILEFKNNNIHIQHNVIDLKDREEHE